MKFNALRSKDTGTRRHYVYNYLYENIIDLTFQPGCGLSENEIGGLLNVSRTPVREAMIQLAKEDLVAIVPQIGTFVSLIDPTLVEESRFMRETLEIAVIKLAAGNINTDTLVELAENLKRQRVEIKAGNYREFLDYDDNFHKIIFSSLGKERTWQAIVQMNAQYKRVRVLRLLTTETSRWEEILTEHENLYKALKSKDAHLAEVMMKDHLTKSVFHLDELKLEHPSYFKI